MRFTLEIVKILLDLLAGLHRNAVLSLSCHSGLKLHAKLPRRRVVSSTRPVLDQTGQSLRPWGYETGLGRRAKQRVHSGYG